MRNTGLELGRTSEASSGGSRNLEGTAHGEPDELAGSTPIAKSAMKGSKSLLASSESDQRPLRSATWDTTAPDPSNPYDTSPLMRQHSSHSIAHGFGDTSRTENGFVNGHASKAAGRADFLNPNTHSFFPSNDHFGSMNSSRHNSDESDRFGARGIFGTQDVSGRTSANNNISGYTSSAASRSGSQPPSRNEIDYSVRHRREQRGPRPVQSASNGFRANGSVHAPAFVAQSALQAQTFHDQSTPTQMDYLTQSFSHLNPGREEHSDLQSNRDGYDHSRPTSHRNFDDAWTPEDNVYRSNSGQMSPAGSAAGSIGSGQLYMQVPNPTQQTGNFNSNGFKRGQQHSYYHPGTHSFQQQPTARAPSNGAVHGQSAILQQKLRGLNEQQQQRYPQNRNRPVYDPSLANHGHFANQMPLPYNMPLQAQMQSRQMNGYHHQGPPQPPYAYPPQVPRGPAREHEPVHPRSALLEDFRINSKTSKKFELKVSRNLEQRLYGG